MKSDIPVNVDLFNRRFGTQFPKVALDYDVNLSRYCQKNESFILIYVVLKNILIVNPLFVQLLHTQITLVLLNY